MAPLTRERLRSSPCMHSCSARPLVLQCLILTSCRTPVPTSILNGAPHVCRHSQQRLADRQQPGQHSLRPPCRLHESHCCSWLVPRLGCWLQRHAGGCQLALGPKQQRCYIEALPGLRQGELAQKRRPSVENKRQAACQAEGRIGLRRQGVHQDGAAFECHASGMELVLQRGAQLRGTLQRTVQIAQTLQQVRQRTAGAEQFWQLLQRTMGYRRCCCASATAAPAACSDVWLALWPRCGVDSGEATVHAWQ